MHLRQLQWFLKPYQRHITSKSEILLQVPLAVRSSLKWWTVQSNLARGKQYLIENEEHITTDASLLGWEAIWRDKPVQGKRSKSESCLPINVLELRAVRLALLHFSEELKDSHVLVRTDNVPTKAHLNKQGGVEIGGPLQLFRWVESHIRSIRAEHVKGVDNVQVDWLSRKTMDPGEWALKRELFQCIAARFGHLSVDLFAPTLNHQVPKFYTRYHHLQVTSQWPPGLLYAFPPIPLLPKVVRKLKGHRASIILVAPDWLRQPWFSTLQQLSQAKPLRLSFSPDMLTQGPVWHPHPDFI